MEQIISCISKTIAFFGHFGQFGSNVRRLRRARSDRLAGNARAIGVKRAARSIDPTVI
jgi:hypothetical protein